MKKQKLTPLAPRAPLGHTISPRPKSSRLSRGPGLPAGNQCFSGLSSGPGRGHFSLENGLSDSWIAKISRCARLRTWGSAPQDQETPSRTLTPSLWRRRRHPVSLDRGPRGPQEGEQRFVFVFYVRGPGPLRWRAGAHSPRDQKRSPLRVDVSNPNSTDSKLAFTCSWAPVSICVALRQHLQAQHVLVKVER